MGKFKEQTKKEKSNTQTKPSLNESKSKTTKRVHFDLEKSTDEFKTKYTKNTKNLVGHVQFKATKKQDNKSTFLKVNINLFLGVLNVNYFYFAVERQHTKVFGNQNKYFETNQFD